MNNNGDWIEPLRPTIARLEEASCSLDAERSSFLSDVANSIAKQLEAPGALGLNFICTHNSRRSHLAQVWAAVAAYRYGLDSLVCLSGGTEATACNPRVVQSFRRAGFSMVNSSVHDSNPRYLIQFSDVVAPMVLFSKKYDDSENGSGRFFAMLCCDHADQNCPVIPGSVGRAALHYRDPKESDGSANEAATYDERRDEIAAEMFFLMRQVSPISPKS